MKLNKTLIGIIAAVVIIGAWAASAYNSMVSEQEKATTALANVQSTYQRRADLIPNLVEVVKGYAAHEKETLEGVVAARSKATQVTLDPTNMTPEKLKEFQQAQGELGAALGRGTENRINEARNTYNGVVQQYNIVIRKFPKNLLAGMFGFEKMDKFEAEAGAEKAPQVKF